MPDEEMYVAPLLTRQTEIMAFGETLYTPARPMPTRRTGDGDDDIVAWSPDIVILAVGHYESLHAYLPRWLERGANTVNRRPGLFRDFY